MRHYINVRAIAIAGRSCYDKYRKYEVSDFSPAIAGEISFMATSVSDVLNNINQRTGDVRPVVTRENYAETPGTLPGEIVALVDNPAYLPRHRRLQREHGNKILLKVAEIAQTKGQPSRWYAKVTSLANWDRTLRFVTKLLSVARRAHEVIEKLGADPGWHQWYMKQLWAHSDAQVAGFVERAARAKSPPRLFAWLAADVRR